VELAYDRRRFHNSSTLLARAQIFGTIELFEDALELGHDVGQLKIFFVKFLVAVLAKPE
jgi:hypothetical protein